MITIIEHGTYKLTETKHGIKLLQLRGKSYAWIVAPRIGALLVYTILPHPRREMLSEGSYRLYKVTDEPHLSDQLHLELEFGPDMWQGYVLPVGFPTRRNPRRRIIPTAELISPSRAYDTEESQQAPKESLHAS